MEISQSIQNSPDKVLLLDTSVLINLFESKKGELILQTIPNKFATTEIVETELMNGRDRRCYDFYLKLLDENIIEKVELDEKELEFQDILTSKDNQFELDQGEASVISLSVNRFALQNYIPIIDENKGRKVITKLISEQVKSCSLELLVHQSVVSKLGKTEHIDVVFSAFYYGKMSVLKEHCFFVIKLIGLNLAEKCTSLTKCVKMFKSGKNYQ